MYKPLDGPDQENQVFPEYDLNVTLRILPRLVQYQGSVRNGISSRSWGTFHDGESYKIDKVKVLPLGSAKKYRRKVGSKDWVDQSSVMKHDYFKLLITPDQGWVKYVLLRS